MLFLRNGVILDGRPNGDSRRVFDEAVRRDVESGSSSMTEAASMEGSTLSIGNKVNHPPRGIQPNVRVVPLDLGRDEHVALHQYLPVVHARPPAGSTPWKRCAVLVASRALCNEELWLDYKLRGDAHRLPDWYAPCDAESQEDQYA